MKRAPRAAAPQPVITQPEQAAEVAGSAGSPPAPVLQSTPHAPEQTAAAFDFPARVWPD